MLIDAALWEEDIDLLFSSNVPYQSLFRGSTGEQLWSVAPNLAQAQSADFFEKIDYLIADDIRIDEKHFLYLSA